MNSICSGGSRKLREEIKVDNDGNYVPPFPPGSVVGSQPSNNGLKVQGFMNFNSSSYSPKISDVLPAVLTHQSYSLRYSFNLQIYRTSLCASIVHPMDSFRPHPVACNFFSKAPVPS